MSIPRYTPFTLIYAASSLGASTPAANTTNVAWVPEPRGRGTFGLVTSCVVTLGLCVWTAIHPDVIPDSTPWRRAWDKVLWMLMALCTPDIVVIHAYKQWREARKTYQSWANFDRSLGKQGAFFAVMHGFSSHLGVPIPPDRVMEALSAYESRHPDLPITHKEVADKGKANTVAKSIVCFQVSWLLINLIARKATGLPIALIELHVVIHILIATVLYGFWWNKPLDVGEPIRLGGNYGRGRGEEPQEVIGLLDYKSTFNLLRLERWEGGYSYSDVTFSELAEDNVEWSSPLIFYLIYAGLHATAWNAQFPTLIECWVWRGACIVVGAVPVIVLVLQKIDDAGCMLLAPDYLKAMIVATQHVLKLVYLVGIAGLLVESFFSLRSLPSEVYQTVTWANYIPHI